MANAADFPTYEAYEESRKAEGMQPIPRVLWEILKEAIEEGM